MLPSSHTDQRLLLTQLGWGAGRGDEGSRKVLTVLALTVMNWFCALWSGRGLELLTCSLHLLLWVLQKASPPHPFVTREFCLQLPRFGQKQLWFAFPRPWGPSSPPLALRWTAAQKVTWPPLSQPRAGPEKLPDTFAPTNSGCAGLSQDRHLSPACQRHPLDLSPTPPLPSDYKGLPFMPE